MASAWSLDIASRTDRGRVRALNEDSLAADARLGFAVLADGMGGCNAGEVASRIAVESLVLGLRELRGQAHVDGMTADVVEDALGRQVLSANEAIYRAAQAEPRYAGMGTTVVAALWRGADLVVAHAGDSRLYRLRDEALALLTHDHSLAQEQVDSGLLDAGQARYASSRSVVTRALGGNGWLEVEVHTHRAQDGDLYLLCSDGLSDMLDDSAMTAILLGGPPELPDMAETLVREANANGGRDNISVVLARLHAAGG